MGNTCGKPQRRREFDSGEASVLENSLEKIETKSGTSVISRVNQYKIADVLGKGAYGAVYRAVDTARGDVVAIKVMEKGELRKKTKQIGRPQPQSQVATTILREIAVMKRVRHVNCVHLFEVIDDPLGDRIFLVMELLQGGEVMAEANLPPDQAHLDEPTARFIFRDLLDGLEYLHGNGILHRDIKPENIVYSELPAFSRTRNASSASGITSVFGGVTEALTSATSNVIHKLTEATDSAGALVTTPRSLLPVSRQTSAASAQGSGRSATPIHGQADGHASTPSASPRASPVDVSTTAAADPTPHADDADKEQQPLKRVASNVSSSAPSKANAPPASGSAKGAAAAPADAPADALADTPADGAAESAAGAAPAAAAAAAASTAAASLSRTSPLLSADDKEDREKSKSARSVSSGSTRSGLLSLAASSRPLSLQPRRQPSPP